MNNKSLDIGGALSSAFAGPVEEDSAPVNVLAGALASHRGTAQKGALEDSPYLLAVRQAVAGLRAGSLPVEDYYVEISKVHQQISALIGLFEMQQVQRELALAGEDHQVLAGRTQLHLEQIEQALGRLVHYLDTQDMADLDEGLAQVEAGYLALDKTQDEALQMVEESDEDDSEEEDL
ncbi:hypothetical protein IV102_00535 [bacterium]|nr:hypothetical protein [bacterium]